MLTSFIFNKQARNFHRAPNILILNQLPLPSTLTSIWILSSRSLSIFSISLLILLFLLIIFRFLFSFSSNTYFLARGTMEMIHTPLTYTLK